MFVCVSARHLSLIPPLNILTHSYERVCFKAKVFPKTGDRFSKISHSPRLMIEYSSSPFFSSLHPSQLPTKKKKSRFFDPELILQSVPLPRFIFYLPFFLLLLSLHLLCCTIRSIGPGCHSGGSASSLTPLERRLRKSFTYFFVLLFNVSHHF